MFRSDLMTDIYDVNIFMIRNAVLTVILIRFGGIGQMFYGFTLLPITFRTLN